MRFFFDYTSQDRSLLDYRGDEFLSPDDALDFAEATAQTMKRDLNGDWIGWSVEVRNADGIKYFSLPVVPVRLATTDVIAKSDRSAGKPGNLLIIEDEPIHCAVISRIAGRVGFTATKAFSYDAACKVLGAKRFDCITLDLGLGEHIGIDVLRYLSTIRCRAQIIVISHSDKDVCNDVVELGKALDLNVYDAVTKPIDLEALREALVHIRVLSLPQASGLNPA
jgi:two-component system, chemotaxis family, chemotaxis protein CheY